MSEWREKVVVYGPPATKGSARAYMPKGGRYPVIVNDNPRGKSWQESIAWEMRRVAPRLPFAEPMAVCVTIHLRRPKTHFGNGKNAQQVRPSAPRFPTTKPDADKMLRVILDAGSGVVWNDDSYVTDIDGVRKRYCQPGEHERTEIEFWPLGDAA